jgi:hypothetical protein
MPNLSAKRRARIGALLGVLAMAVVSATVVAKLQQASRRVRTIPWTTTPITDRLRPDDDIVIVDRVKESAQFDREPTWLEFTRLKADSSNMIVVVEIADVGPVLAEKDTWIDTRASGTVKEVLMSGEPAGIAREQRIAFQNPGGEMMIGQVLVRAWDKMRVERGKRYFVFLWRNADTGVLYANHAPLLIDKGTLTNPWESESSTRRDLPYGVKRDPLHGLKLADVANEVKRFAKEPIRK